MFVQPNEIVANIGVMPGMKVADFGSGSGHFALALSAMVGEQGVMYAIDVQKNMLDALQSAAQVRQINNISVIWADLDRDEGSRLEPRIIDLVFIGNILFQVEDREQLAREAHRILKPGGMAVVVEWEKVGGKFGPPSHARVGKEEAKTIFIGQGFTFEREFPAGDNHYGIIFRRA